MRRKVSLFLLIIMLHAVFASGFVSAAKNDNTTVSINAKSALLMEASTGTVLYKQNENERLAPASVTKIMTMLLVMEAIDSGRIALTDKVQCSEYAASMGGSQIWLEPGEEMTVNDLLKTVAVASANDASVMLAEHISGSADIFIEQMNNKAKALGMNNTTFKNCTGLEDPEHRTTAYDVALMSRELLKHEKIFEYTTIWMDSVRNGKFGLANTNKLIKTYNGANGLKTGSTDTALYCLSATAKRDNMQLIAVVLGGPTSKERFNAASKLLDMGFAQYTFTKGVENPGINKVKVIRGLSDMVAPYIEEVPGVLIEKGKENLLTFEISLNPKVLAPVEKDQKLGEIIYKIEGKEIMRVPIKASQEVKKAGFIHILKKIFISILIN